MSYAIFDVYYGVPVDPEKRAVMGASLAKTDPEFDGKHLIWKSMTARQRQVAIWKNVWMGYLVYIPLIADQLQIHQWHLASRSTPSMSAGTISKSPV